MPPKEMNDEACQWIPYDHICRGSNWIARTGTGPAPDAKPETEVRTFYLNNVVQGDQAGNEILNALRVSLDSHDSFFLDNYLEAIVLAAFGASRRTPRNFNFETVLTFVPAPSSYLHLVHRSS